MAQFLIQAFPQMIKRCDDKLNSATHKEISSPDFRNLNKQTVARSKLDLHFFLCIIQQSGFFLREMTL